MFSIFLRVVAVVQIILGLAYLIAPDQLLHSMGHSLPATDLHYPLGMLAARFLAYGVGFWLISRAPQQHLLWIRLMACIQGIDLTVGLYYTAAGVVPLTLSSLPMFNALWIGITCALWRPTQLKAA